MKTLFTLFLVLVTGAVIAQPMVNRSGASVTAVDANLVIPGSFRLPVFADTASATIGLDHRGKLVYITGTGVWYRDSLPKRWLRIAGVGGSTSSRIYAGAGLINVNDSTLRIDTLSANPYAVATLLTVQKRIDSLLAVIGSRGYLTFSNYTLPYNGNSGYYLGGDTILHTLPASSSGTLSDITIVTANGISGTITNSTTTPAITLMLGGITPSSVTSGGTITGSNLSGTNTGDETTARINALYGYTPARSDSLAAHNLRLLTIVDSIVAHNLRILSAVNAGNTETAARIAADATKQNLVTLTTTGTSGAATFNQGTGALNIPSYSGGASGDSSFATIEIGTPYPIVGTLLNENFGTTPASFTKGANLTVTYSGKAIVTGANFWTIPAQGANTTAWGAALQYNTRRMPYEKMDFSITVVPQTKSAGGLIALTKGRLDNSGGVVGSTRPTIAWDLSNSYTSGRVANGLDSLVTFSTSTDSSSRMSWNPFDTLTLYGHIDAFTTTAGINNKTTGKSSIQKMPTILGSGGLWNFIFLKNNYHVLNVKATATNRKGGVYVIGTSQTAGTGVQLEGQRYANKVFNSNDQYYSVLGLPSVSAKAFVNGGLPAELIADAQPSKVLVELEYNDETDVTTAPVYSQSIDSVIYPFQRFGSTVYTISSIPRQSTSTVYNDTLVAVAGRRNSTVVDITTRLKNGGTMLYGGYLYDPVHLNAIGNALVASDITAKIGADILSEMAADTLSVAKFSKLHSSQSEEIVKGAAFNKNTDGTWELVTIAKPIAAINNSYTTNAIFPKTIAQPTSSIHTTNEIRTNTYFQNSGNGVGLQIGFANDTSTAGLSTNIEVSNKASAGAVGQTFRPYTPAGYNVSIGAHSKTGTDGTLTSAATGNIGIGYGTLEALTSGANNLEIRPASNTANGPSGITTGNRNIVMSYYAGPTTGSDQILLGSWLAWGNASNRIHIGNNGGGSAATNEIVLAANENVSQTFYVGGKATTGNSLTTTIKVPASSATTLNGMTLNIEGGSTTSTSTPGGINLRTTATANNSTYTNRLSILTDQIILNGGVQFVRRAIVDAASTIATSDYLLVYTTLTATRAVTLPSAASTSGQHFVIKDEAGTAGTNNITIVGTIDGASNPTAVNANYGKYKFYSNGTAFFSE